MTDIAGLEARIAAALTRIERAMAAPAAGPAGDAAEAALAAEREANRQLTERVRALRARQDTMVAGLEKRIAQLTRQVDAQSVELRRLRRVNAQVAAVVQGLRAAAAEGGVDPAFVDRAMAAELETLRLARDIEVAEMDDILAALDPLVAEAEARHAGA